MFKKKKLGFAKSSLQVRSTAELDKEVNEMLNVPDPPSLSGVAILEQRPEDCMEDKENNENS